MADIYAFEHLDQFEPAVEHVPDSVGVADMPADQLRVRPEAAFRPSVTSCVRPRKTQAP